MHTYIQTHTLSYALHIHFLLICIHPIITMMMVMVMVMANLCVYVCVCVCVCVCVIEFSSFLGARMEMGSGYCWTCRSQETC